MVFCVSHIIVVSGENWVAIALLYLRLTIKVPKDRFILLPLPLYELVYFKYRYKNILQLYLTKYMMITMINKAILLMYSPVHFNDSLLRRIYV